MKQHDHQGHEPQPPRMRRKYHGISSGRLPDQMSRNCEICIYAQSMTKVRSKLPRSRRWLGAITSDKGGCPARSIKTAMANAMAVSSWLVAYRAGKIVEYQSGSMDMVQSIEANLMVNPYNTLPAPLRRLKRRHVPATFVSSSTP